MVIRVQCNLAPQLMEASGSSCAAHPGMLRRHHCILHWCTEVAMPFGADTRISSALWIYQFQLDSRASNHSSLGTTRHFCIAPALRSTTSPHRFEYFLKVVGRVALAPILEAYNTKDTLILCFVITPFEDSASLKSARGEPNASFALTRKENGNVLGNKYLYTTFRCIFHSP